MFLVKVYVMPYNTSYSHYYGRVRIIYLTAVHTLTIQGRRGRRSRLLVEHGPVDNLMIKTQLRLCHTLALEIAYDELLETMGEL